MRFDHRVISLKKQKIPALAGVMSRAFENEPNFIYLLPDQSKRRHALEWFFRFVFNAAVLSHGECLTTMSEAGAAIWLKPGGQISPGNALMAGLLRMPYQFGWSGFMRSVQLSGKLEKRRKELMPQSHWYLTALGIDPAMQGKGIGRSLLEPILAKADAEGIPCYLETFHARNLGFYERFGFRVSSRETMARDRLHFWIMIRPV